MKLKTEKRIQSYLKFLKECDKAMAICGVFLLCLATLIFFLLQSSKYFYLFVGFGLVGIALVIKYVYLYSIHSKLEVEDIDADFETKLANIKNKIKIYSLGLVIGVIISILIILINVRTELLLSIIPIILYSAVEYIASLLQLFRLNILKQELGV